MTHRRITGFSLIELLVTVSVLGILVALAAPSFQSLIRANRIANLTNDLVSGLNLARSEAIKRGTRVTLCKVADPNTNTPTCSTSANWQTGWQVFVDGSTAGTFDGTDTRIAVGQPSSNGSDSTITPDAVFTNFISYDGRGASNSSGNLVVCLGGLSRTIKISATGRIQTTSGTC
ncbi:MAG: GspH/FimT family pseudopilin [Sulfuricella sp.]